MRKKFLVVIGIIVIIIVGIGGKVKLDSKKQTDEMVKIVNSQEAKEVFEETIKNLDPKAFTDGGVINSYEINEKSIRHNPMGGINVTLNINQSNDIKINFTLNKYNEELESGAISYSGVLADLLEDNENE